MGVEDSQRTCETWEKAERYCYNVICGASAVINFKALRIPVTGREIVAYYS